MILIADAEVVSDLDVSSDVESTLRVFCVYAEVVSFVSEGACEETVLVKVGNVELLSVDEWRTVDEVVLAGWEVEMLGAGSAIGVFLSGEGFGGFGLDDDTSAVCCDVGGGHGVGEGDSFIFCGNLL